jgi:nitrous oxidase accessory protein NosD
MRRGFLISGTAACLLAGSALAAPSALAAGPLPNGFTAKVIARSGQTITGPVDATGFDLGIYIGPGVHGVRVVRARVTGANAQGILVQDTSDVVIERSTVEGNARNFPAQLGEVKAITLAGTRHVVVTRNTVDGNGDGGIGVYDDGLNSPATIAPVAVATTPIPGVGNVVSGNDIRDNVHGCGIVVSAKNPGGGVADTVVIGNTVTGFDPADGDQAPGTVGGIVVAGGSFGAVQVSRTVVLGNRITGGLIPGISLHAGAPGTITGTQLVGNRMARNGGTPTSGVESATAGGTISGTRVIGDSVAHDDVGVFHVGDTGTRIVGLTTSDVPAREAP